MITVQIMLERNELKHIIKSYLHHGYQWSLLLTGQYSIESKKIKNQLKKYF